MENYKTKKNLKGFFKKDIPLTESNLKKWFTSLAIKNLENQGYIENDITEVDFEEGKIIMENGKIYSIQFGENVQLIVRFSHEDCCHLIFKSELHYWNGAKSLNGSGYCVKNGITEIRRASKSEKHSLVEIEIEKELI